MFLQTTKRNLVKMEEASNQMFVKPLSSFSFPDDFLDC
jgi:hypothetical protein